jgi:20S proteasome alpha/beta subunit
MTTASLMRGTVRIRSVLFVLAILALGIVRVEAQDLIAMGTVNIILANSEGIVVLTDSKETWNNAAGESIRSTNAQKLIRIDDQSVVALAGFVGAPEFLRLDVMGILADVRNQLAEKNRTLSLDEKMKMISFLVGRYMDVFVNAREVQQPGQEASSFRIHIFIAGFDTDGVMKIGSMWLRANSTMLPEGRTR